MNKYTKYAIGVLVGLALFGGGYYAKNYLVYHSETQLTIQPLESGARGAQGPCGSRIEPNTPGCSDSSGYCLPGETFVGWYWVGGVRYAGCRAHGAITLQPVRN